MRKNPNYPPYHQFTVVKCETCGEYYEADCDYPHKCRKQNSYPAKDPKKSALERVLFFPSIVSDITKVQW